MAKKKKKTKVPGAYLSGIIGGKRKQLESTIKRISKLYKAGKRIPQALINKRIKLGKKKS